MRICVFTGIFPPDIGGPSTYLYRLSNDLVKLGHEIRVLTYGEQSSINFSYPVKRIPRRSYVVRVPQSIVKLAHVGKTCDVIYSHGGPFSTGVVAVITKKIIGRPLVIKVTGDFAWEFSLMKGWTSDGIDEFQGKRYSFRVELIRWIQRLVAVNADLVIVPSHYLKKIVGGWGVSPEKVRVIHNAPTEERAPISRGAARGKLGLDGKIIVTISRLVPWKGVDTLIQVMPELIKDVGSDLRLVVVGDGPDMSKLRQLARDSGVGDNVVFAGRVPHDEIPAYLSASDLFVLNTEYEGFSHILLEAMMAGTPVITTDVGGNPELIEDGVNGLLVKPNTPDELKEAITKLLVNDTLRNKFTVNSEARIKQFTWSSLVENTLNVLKSMAR